MSAKRPLALCVLVAALAPRAGAWPQRLTECVLRDARRLVPRSLAELLRQRDVRILEAMRRYPPDVESALRDDLAAGALRPETLQALHLFAGEPVRLLGQQQVGEGVVHLGALLRIPAELSDPAATAGAAGLPAGVAEQYYAFVEASLDKLPVTLDDPAALKLASSELPAYWARLHADSRAQVATLRSELVRGGRVVDYRAIDYRSPAFAVAQIAYSRAVTASAATWLALWRAARGDMTRMPAPRVLQPVDRGPGTSAATPPASAAGPSSPSGTRKER